MKRFNTVYSHAKPTSPCGGVSMTEQQYREECDINSILKRFGATGKLPEAHTNGVSGDFSDVGDFANCLDKINRAKDEFAALPSALRSRFGNDPRAYVEFVLNPANKEELIRLGLAEVRHDEPSAKDFLREIAENTKKSKDIVTPKGESVA